MLYYKISIFGGRYREETGEDCFEMGVSCYSFFCTGLGSMESNLQKHRLQAASQRLLTSRRSQWQNNGR